MFFDGLPFQGVASANDGGGQKYYLDGLPLESFLQVTAAGGNKAVFIL